MYERYADDEAIIHDVGDLSQVSLADGWEYDGKAEVLDGATVLLLRRVVTEIPDEPPAYMVTERKGRTVLTAYAWLKLANQFGITFDLPDSQIEWGRDVTVHPDWGPVPERVRTSIHATAEFGSARAVAGCRGDDPDLRNCLLRCDLDGVAYLAEVRAKVAAVATLVLGHGA